MYKNHWIKPVYFQGQMPVYLKEYFRDEKKKEVSYWTGRCCS
jgi:hypothetical protein